MALIDVAAATAYVLVGVLRVRKINDGATINDVKLYAVVMATCVLGTVIYKHIPSDMLIPSAFLVFQVLNLCKAFKPDVHGDPTRYVLTITIGALIAGKALLHWDRRARESDDEDLLQGAGDSERREDDDESEDRSP